MLLQCECEGLVLLVEIELERGGWGCIFSALDAPQELLDLLKTCHLGIEITWMCVWLLCSMCLCVYKWIVLYSVMDSVYAWLVSNYFHQQLLKGQNRSTNLKIVIENDQAYIFVLSSSNENWKWACFLPRLHVDQFPLL